MNNILTPEDVAFKIEQEFMCDGEFAEQWRKEVMNVLESLDAKFAEKVHSLVLEGEAYQTHLSELEMFEEYKKHKLV